MATNETESTDERDLLRKLIRRAVGIFLSVAFDKAEPEQSDSECARRVTREINGLIDHASKDTPYPFSEKQFIRCLVARTCVRCVEIMAEKPIREAQESDHDSKL